MEKFKYKNLVCKIFLYRKENEQITTTTTKTMMMMQNRSDLEMLPSLKHFYYDVNIVYSVIFYSRGALIHIFPPYPIRLIHTL